ncbi:MAG: YtxH domain-containing protein [Actinomycetota bacterium]|nr:YtxH domain-containing protein [Actinomycetota bacterium]
MSKNNAATVIMSFALGGLVGAGVALLFAPQSGQKTRRKIIDAVEDAREEISDYADKLKSRLS